MSTSLYRRYRPKTFDEVVNQRHVVETLIHELQNNRLAHAYLFCGPRGVGKTTVARLLAKAANSPKRLAGKPGWQALDDIPDGHTIDIIEIDAASHTQVDNVRQNIIPNAQTAPTVSAYKVFIIDEVHMLSISAFNALLKILEEPPASVIFILATTEIHRVPATIISRCQRFDFHRIQRVDLIKRIETVAQYERITVDPDVARSIAVLADGSARDADSLFGQLISLGETHITAALAAGVLPRTDAALLVTLFESLARQDIRQALQELQRGVDEGVVMSRLGHDWLELLRQTMLARLGVQPWDDLTVAEADELAKIKTAAETLTGTRLLECITVFQKHLRNLSLADQPQFPFELAFVELIGGVIPTDIPPARPTPMPAAPVRPTVKPPKVSEPTPAPVPAPAPVAKKTTPRRPSAASTMSVDDIKKVWPAISKDVGANNHSLGMILKSAVISTVRDDNTIVLGFGFKLHAERVLSQKNREIIAQALEAALGTHVLLQTEVDSRYIKQTSDVSEPSAKESAELSDMVMNTFGSKAVS